MAVLCLLHQSSETNSTAGKDYMNVGAHKIICWNYQQLSYRENLLKKEFHQSVLGY